jgi:hypothetical protein
MSDIRKGMIFIKFMRLSEDRQSLVFDIVGKIKTADESTTNRKVCCYKNIIAGRRITFRENFKSLIFYHFQENFSH